MKHVFLVKQKVATVSRLDQPVVIHVVLQRSYEVTDDATHSSDSAMEHVADPQHPP